MNDKNSLIFLFETSKRTCMTVCLCVCVFVSVGVCVCVCVYTHTHTHTHTHTQSDPHVFFFIEKKCYLRVVICYLRPVFIYYLCGKVTSQRSWCAQDGL
jgi:hypothetical protein